MPEPPVWQLLTAQPPAAFVEAVQRCGLESGLERGVDRLAQLLWQRGIQDPSQIAGFLDPNHYTPTSPFAFGDEMEWAIDRLQQAIRQQERVAIWGDFDADGVTATAVLWDGLGQFLIPQNLTYYIPNRLTESHGLSQTGIDRLHASEVQLIVTCDTGSTNLAEIEYARQRGIDVIVTDHHTLLSDRPPVAALINPRSLPPEHPLAALSGVAVAYKLVEALYETLPHRPQKPLTELLDLVAIGLIADLVELKGDCRYLAQRGIEQLQKQSNPTTATRPGVFKLLELCKRSGDRPTDISFGLGPRINAVSRIQGDAHFCVELLTSRDMHVCTHLAEATELANIRRKALQTELVRQVSRRLTHLDLSTTRVIVLADEQWQPGVLGLVAGQIAQEYGRPTILLSRDVAGALPTEIEPESDSEVASIVNSEGSPDILATDILATDILATDISGTDIPAAVPMARGSARSTNGIDLYQLVSDQAHLLHRFGGHPFAAGLSLPVENLPLFTQAIDQRLRQSSLPSVPPLTIDLVVTVAELGAELFQVLKRLEPCGMGNPVPRLLIENCWCDRVWNKKIQDWKGRTVQYIKTEFELWDDTAAKGFPGIWWGHYRDELPTGRCDMVVELDSNNFKRRYEIRLVAVRPRADSSAIAHTSNPAAWILDYRGQPRPTDPTLLCVTRCPSSWIELQGWFRRAQREQRPLAIAYPPPRQVSSQEIWQQWVGIAKYLARTEQSATRQQLLDRLQISDRALQLGIRSLSRLGFRFTYSDQAFQIRWEPTEAIEPTEPDSLPLRQFVEMIREEQFQQTYFYQVPLQTIQGVANHTST